VLVEMRSYQEVGRGATPSRDRELGIITTSLIRSTAYWLCARLGRSRLSSRRGSGSSMPAKRPFRLFNPGAVRSVRGAPDRGRKWGERIPRQRGFVTRAPRLCEAGWLRATARPASVGEPEHFPLDSGAAGAVLTFLRNLAVGGGSQKLFRED
jgi:hypothetical protein